MHLLVDSTENADTLIELLPKKKLEIKFNTGTFSDMQTTKLKNACASWSLNDGKFTDSHDRYLIIDDKVEIILTSGFSYLKNETKEITYIVRVINGHQFM